jgi:hypothetical protein
VVGVLGLGLGLGLGENEVPKKTHPIIIAINDAIREVQNGNFGISIYLITINLI